MLRAREQRIGAASAVIEYLTEPPCFRDSIWSGDYLPYQRIWLKASAAIIRWLVKIEPISEAELLPFTGTECWYRHTVNRQVRFTDGVKYVADRANAYWLLDEIAMIQMFNKQIANKRFQVWKLQVAHDLSAELLCEDGNSRIVYSKEIASTDFPGPGVTLWFIGHTILLPSEY